MKRRVSRLGCRLNAVSAGRNEPCVMCGPGIPGSPHEKGLCCPSYTWTSSDLPTVDIQHIVNLIHTWGSSDAASGYQYAEAYYSGGTNCRSRMEHK